MNSVWRSVLLVIVGSPLLLLLAGGPEVVGQKPKAVRSRVPGASGGSKLQVKFHIAPGANYNNPIAVDLVLVSNKKLLQELTKMSASEWFANRRQIQLDYPRETDLAAGSWEWASGQVVGIYRLPVKRGIVGGVIFAYYFSEGPHRAVINPRKDILITLGKDDLCVQSGKEIAQPCTVSPLKSLAYPKAINSADEALGNYHEIENSFNQNLAGASGASCLQSKVSTTWLLACAPTAPNSSARWPNTRTSTDSATCGALQASSLRWPRNSSEAQ